MRLIYRVCVIASTVLLATPNAGATTIISDSTFLDANWSAYLIVNTSGNSTVSGLQNVSLGQPAPGRDVTISAVDSGPNSASGGHLFSTSYDPSTSGAIETIDLFLDANVTSAGTNGAVAIAVYARQSGTSMTAGYQLVLEGAGWTPVSITGRTASDFSALDFSSSGAPIEFGFSTAVSTGSPLGLAYANVTVDNFIVEITQVPEPSSALLIAAGLFGLALRRRRS